MKIAVASDWHLGSPQQKDEPLVWEFLDWAQEYFDYTVLNGDILDVWRLPYRTLSRRLKHFIRKIEGLRERGCLEFIVGNHDDLIQDKFQLPDGVVLPETDIYVTHGHQWDWTCYGKGRWIGFFGNRLLRIVEDLFYEDIQELFMDTCHALGYKKLKSPKYHDGFDIYEEEGLALIDSLKDQGVQRLIHGHTHRASLGDGRVMNAGCTLIGFATYILVDTETGECHLRDMKEDAKRVRNQGSPYADLGGRP